MRATLLLLLGGILVWFVWHSFGSGNGTALANPPPPGTMLEPGTADETPLKPSSTPGSATATTAPLAGAAIAPQARSGKELAAKEGPAKPAVEQENAAQAGAAKGATSKDAAAKDSSSSMAGASALAQAKQLPATPPAAARTGDLASEIELSRALVSDPQGFAAFAATRSDVSRSRRDFAIALSKALTGAEPEARRLLQGLEDSPDVRVSEREFLSRCIEHRVSGPVPASAEHESLLVRAGTLVAAGREADAARTAGKNKEAAQLYSALLLDYVAAPWVADPAVLRRWSDALNAVQRGYRWDKNADWPAVTTKVEPGDSLIALRKRVLKEHPELLVCTGEIERANQITGTVLRPGQVLRVPTSRARMLVDLDAHWAFYLLGDEVAAAYEVGVGKEGSATRAGTYTVGEKKEKPMWFRPGGNPVPYGDPENPLGTRWIAWTLPGGGSSGLGFHGTNDPDSVGKDQSQGCIRMRNADVEELFEILPRDAEITVQP